MNREIVFRGKLVDNGEWVKGYFFKWPCVSWKELSCVIVPVIGLENGIAEQTIVDPATVGQWTGLIDKNGKKVFEGDILQFGERRLVVWWNGEAFQWQAKSVLGYNLIYYTIYDDTDWTNIDLGWIYAEVPSTGKMATEIVGNIYDNPELLEVQNA